MTGCAVEPGLHPRAIPTWRGEAAPLIDPTRSRPQLTMPTREWMTGTEHPLGLPSGTARNLANATTRAPTHLRQGDTNYPSSFPATT